MMGGGSDDLFNEMSSKWWAVVVTSLFNEWAVVVTIFLSSKMKCPVNDGRW